MTTVVPSLVPCVVQHLDTKHAYQLFDKMPNRHSNVVSLSPIVANAKSGDLSRTFELFAKLSRSPWWLSDEFALGALLKVSSGISNARLGKQLHAKAIRTRLASEPGLRTSLITMYSTCGLLEESRRVFDEVPLADETDIPSWNSIISAYAFHGYFAECCLLFSAMLRIAQLAPTDATYAIVISACSMSKEVGIGKIVHAMIIKHEMREKTKMFNSLITMYAKSGLLEDAEKVFEAMDEMNIVSWNAMVSGYEQNGESGSALGLFRKLTGSHGRTLGKPNRITLLSVLSAVSSLLALKLGKLGKEVHAQVIKVGLECETSTGNALITMYGKCGEVVKGRLVFERMSSRDVISWNSMLAGYAQNRQPLSCHQLFREMQVLGIKPDAHTLIALLGGLSLDPFASNSCRFGREIHGYLLRRVVPTQLQVSAYNAILTMYAKSSRLEDAEKVFEGMAERDSFSWNALMDGYAMNGCCDDAVMLFVDMHEQGLQFDHSTFSILLTACGRLVSVELGMQLHALTIKYCSHHSTAQGFLLSTNNVLVSMYSKCGCISEAVKIFQRMVKRDVFSWTAIITGYACHGMACESLRFFERMRRDGVQPNSVTFLGLLTACAHAGLVEEGVQYFTWTMGECDVEPCIEHYACMVDLFGRSGQFERAEAMVQTGITHLGLKQSSSLCLWKVLLGACHAHKQLELGVHVGTKILELEPGDETTHVLLSNIYAAFGLWENATAVRRMMRERGLKKEAGCSWVEVGKRRHVFVAGDSCHPNRKEIYEKLVDLNERCRGIGYVPMTDNVLHDVDEMQKKLILSSHSEKLAVSFALLQTRGRKGVVRVIKNLRACEDCHTWMKFASKVEDRVIVLRDSRRFHSFKGGKCSCGDYW